MVTRKQSFYVSDEGYINSEAWLNHIAMQWPESKLRLIRHAIALSKLTGTTQKTPLGISCLQQSLIMADLLLDLMLDEDTICAALLYNSVYYAELGLDTVEVQLNRNVSKLLCGALRMNNISSFTDTKNIKQNQLENFRKMLLSIADDMRVVLLKLAERIAWMRIYKQQIGVRTAALCQYARESLNIYAPLANRLGIDALRYELEDLAMEQLAPSVYKNMAQLVQEPLLDRENYLKELKLAIEIALTKIGIQEFKVTSRVKNFYGIYRKMRKKKVGIHEVHDLNAIRIMVETIKECYKVLEVIRSLWTAVPNHFDDYIKFPKENNYQSIHLAIYGSGNKVIEIQIRTFEMHQESEHGIAAHWQYKEGTLHKPDYHAKIAWLRQVINWQKELVKTGIYLMPDVTATLDDRVYVLTPAGDILDLPKGATALDFAYYIHSDMGHYCHSVKINDEPKPLHYVLNTGEKIEIFTGKHPTLKWEWLDPEAGYLNTAKAKADVLHWFQQKDHYQHIITGQLLLEKSCNKLGLKFVDQEKLANEFHFNSKQELLAALGSGELRIVHVLHALHEYSKQSSALVNQEEIKNPSLPLQIADELIMSTPFNAKSADKIPLASCCKPIPGDPIQGSITEMGIVLHRKNCQKIVLEQKINSAHQVMEPSAPYMTNNNPNYSTNIYIEAELSNNLIEDIFQLINTHMIQLIGFSSAQNESNQRMYIILQLKIFRHESLENFLKSLRNTAAIIAAYQQD